MQKKYFILVTTPFSVSDATLSWSSRTKRCLLQVEDDWKYVAMVLDRIFLFAFTIACVLGTALIIFRAPTFYDNSKPIDILYSKIAKKKLELLRMGSEADPGL